MYYFGSDLLILHYFSKVSKRMVDSLYRGCEIQGIVRQTISSLIIKK